MLHGKINRNVQVQYRAYKLNMQIQHRVYAPDQVRDDFFSLLNWKFILSLKFGHVKNFKPNTSVNLHILRMCYVIKEWFFILIILR